MLLLRLLIDERLMFPSSKIGLELQLSLGVDASKFGAAQLVVVVVDKVVCLLVGLLVSETSSFTISKVPLGVRSEIHTVSLFSIVPTMELLAPCRRSSLRLYVLRSFFVAMQGLHSWTLYKIDRKVIQLDGYLLK